MVCNWGTCNDGVVIFVKYFLIQMWPGLLQKNLRMLSLTFLACSLKYFFVFFTWSPILFSIYLSALQPAVFWSFQGNMGLKSEDVAVKVRKAIDSFDQNNPKTLRTIEVCIFQKQMMTHFEQSLGLQQQQNISGSFRGFITVVKKCVGGKRSYSYF